MKLPTIDQNDYQLTASDSEKSLVLAINHDSDIASGVLWALLFLRDESDFSSNVISGPLRFQALGHASNFLRVYSMAHPWPNPDTVTID